METIQAAHLNQAMKVIGDYFGKQYPPQSVNVILEAATKEPTKALARTVDRVFAEYLPTRQPPIDEIRKMIQHEGKNVRLEEGDRIESEWNREKGVDGNGRVSGNPLNPSRFGSEYATRAARVVRLMLSENGTRENVTKALHAMASAYPESEYPKMHRHYDLHGSLDSCQLRDR